MLEERNCGLWLTLLSLIVLSSYGAHSSSTDAKDLALSTNCTGSEVKHCAFKSLTHESSSKITQLLDLSTLIVSHSVLSVGNYTTSNLQTVILQNSTFADIQRSHLTHLTTLAIQNTPHFEISENTFAVATELEQLMITRSKISNLHSNLFSKLKKLKHLDLQQNEISELPHELLSELVALEYLDLSNNRMKAIVHESFPQNPVLKTIHLNNNKILHFDETAVIKNQHVNFLDVSNNYIEELNLPAVNVDTLLAKDGRLKHCTISGGVIYFDGSSNHLEEVQIHKKLRVQHLILRNNHFETLESFVGMLNLELLDLSHNNVYSLSTESSPLYIMLPSLKNLNLAHNKIQSLTRETFIRLQKLTHLDLSYNYLETLDARMFEPLYLLEELFVEGNNLHHFDYEIFQPEVNPYLQNVYLFHNAWQGKFLRRMLSFFKTRKIGLPVRKNTTQENDSLRINGPSILPPQIGNDEAGVSAADAESPLNHFLLTCLTVFLISIVLLLILLTDCKDNCWPMLRGWCANCKFPLYRKFSNVQNEQQENNGNIL